MDTITIEEDDIGEAKDFDFYILTLFNLLI